MNMEVLQIDFSNILDYLRIEPPYLFVDKASVLPGKSAVGHKFFSLNEWFFKCHLPGDPVVPAVFILEGLIQTAALAIHSVVPGEHGKIYAKKFSCDVVNAVRPGCELVMDTKILSFRRGIANAHGEAYFRRNGEDVRACVADFVMIMPNVLASMAPPAPVKANKDAM